MLGIANGGPYVVKLHVGVLWHQACIYNLFLRIYTITYWGPYLTLRACLSLFICEMMYIWSNASYDVVLPPKTHNRKPRHVDKQTKADTTVNQNDPQSFQQGTPWNLLSYLAAPWTENSCALVATKYRFHYSHDLDFHKQRATRLTKASLVRESKQNSEQKSIPSTAMKFMTLHQTQRLGIQPPATLKKL